MKNENWITVLIAIIGFAGGMFLMNKDNLSDKLLWGIFSFCWISMLILFSAVGYFLADSSNREHIEDLEKEVDRLEKERGSIKKFLK